MVSSLRAHGRGQGVSPGNGVPRRQRGSSTRAASRRVPVVAFALAVLLPGPLRAETTDGPASVPVTTGDAAERATVGDAASALPGIHRVGIPGSRTSVVSLAATAGYAFTEAQGAQDGTNHRALGSVAVAVSPLDGLALGLRLDGRYDVHPADADGSDTGGVGEPRLTVRVGDRWGAVRLGGELVAWLPGGDAPAVDFAATTLDVRGLFALTPGRERTTIGSLIGFRWDNSAAIETEAERLRQGDRVALGVSEFDALLLGLGLSQALGKTELLGELSADWLLGANAPALGSSPVRISLGVRHPLSARLAFEALVEVVPTGRPSVAPGAPLAPIEPRGSLLVGMRSRLRPLAAPAVAPPPPPVIAPPPPKAEPNGIVSEPPPQPVPVVCRLTGSVVDEGGKPIVDAEVKVAMSERELVVRTDATGGFEFRGEVCGTGTLAVAALDFDPVTREVELAEAAATPVEILLRPAVPAGELRGLVRSLDGKPVLARVQVVGTDLKATTGADGSFTLQVPPGSYLVEVEADGFARQRRTVRIENRGVTILNADVRTGP